MTNTTSAALPSVQSLRFAPPNTACSKILKRNLVRRAVSCWACYSSILKCGHLTLLQASSSHCHEVQHDLWHIRLSSSSRGPYGASSSSSALGSGEVHQSRERK
eukprot:5067623-Amphidinium_carterae.1